MTQKVQLKRSAVQGKLPTTGDLDLGEVAINTYDGRFFFKKDDGTAAIVELLSTTAANNVLSGYQPLDGDLSSIAQISGTSGLLKKTAANTWSLDTTDYTDVSNLSSGTISTARLGSGTADSTTYLRGDNTWATVTSGATISDDTSTDTAYYPSLAVATSGAMTTAKVSSTKLTFNPNTGTLSATVFSGSGASLTNLNASNLSSGTVATTRLGSGTADNTTYLRGDNTWQSLNSATVGLGNVENTSLSTWTGSTNITTLGTVTTGTFSGTLGAISGESLTNLNADNLSTGLIDPARMGNGSADSTTYLRGDNTWATVTAGGAVNNVFWENDQTVSANYTITAGKNAGTFGPVTINTGIEVTIPVGSTWSIV